jgi:hypothetical protein
MSRLHLTAGRGVCGVCGDVRLVAVIEGLELRDERGLPHRPLMLDAPAYATTSIGEATPELFAKWLCHQSSQPAVLAYVGKQPGEFLPHRVSGTPSDARTLARAGIELSAPVQGGTWRERDTA